MVRRACLFLLATLGLAACANSGPYRASGEPASVFRPTESAAQNARASARKVAILLPLSGPLARIGQQMLQAAELSLAQPGSPAFQAIDTKGTPAGAAAATSAAIADHAGLIIGPLTSGSTAAAAPLARRADVPMLAFTNDNRRAEPGVWVLGITPEQQVRQLMSALAAQGETRLAALLPENAYGFAMQQAVQATASSLGAPPPLIQNYGAGMASLNQAVRSVSDYANRRGPIEAEMRAANALDTEAGRERAHALNREPIPPPPFDALLVVATGTPLEEIGTLLPYYDIQQGQVQIVGPILWQDPNVRRGISLTDAWYPAPDPNLRQPFVSAYEARYGAAPPALADLAYDAAGLAKVLAQGPGYTTAALTTPAGFLGADGVLALQPNGKVTRGLAIMEIGPGGAPSVFQPAARTPLRLAA